MGENSHFSHGEKPIFLSLRELVPANKGKYSWHCAFESVDKIKVAKNLGPGMQCVSDHCLEDHSWKVGYLFATQLLTIGLNSKIYFPLGRMRNAVSTESHVRTVGQKANNPYTHLLLVRRKVYPANFLVNIHRRALPRVWSSPFKMKVIHDTSFESSSGSCATESIAESWWPVIETCRHKKVEHKHQPVPIFLRREESCPRGSTLRGVGFLGGNESDFVTLNLEAVRAKQKQTTFPFGSEVEALVIALHLLNLPAFLSFSCVEVSSDWNFVTTLNVCLDVCRWSLLRSFAARCRSTRVYAAPSRASESCTRPWLGEGRCSSRMLSARETIRKWSLACCPRSTPRKIPPWHSPAESRWLPDITYFSSVPSFAPPWRFFFLVFVVGPPLMAYISAYVVLLFVILVVWTVLLCLIKLCSFCRYMFHYTCEDGIIYICITDDVSTWMHVLC